jgi:hypothetical protein
MPSFQQMFVLLFLSTAADIWISGFIRWGLALEIRDDICFSSYRMVRGHDKGTVPIVHDKTRGHALHDRSVARSTQVEEHREIKSDTRFSTGPWQYLSQSIAY